MRRREIRTSHEQVSCDVCGRTLLRGEQAEPYLDHGYRKMVCDLCAGRAMQEGWTRDGGDEVERSRREAEQRSSFLNRLRARRERRDGLPSGDFDEPPPGFFDEDGPVDLPGPAEPEEPPYDPAAPVRHVRAVPASVVQKTMAALERFNATEHTRTIAGIARSLGEPVVTARASAGHASEVDVVVAWELCWYRYRVDLGVAQDAVAPAGQGYDLEDLDPEEREGNALMDPDGFLMPAQEPHG